MRHIISVLLENEPGALSRVAGLFSARGYNIESLSVAPTEDPSVSRMTLATGDYDEESIEQITKQLNKLIDVIKLIDLTEGGFVEREMLLIKLRVGSNEAKEEVRRLTEIFHGHIIDVSSVVYTVELTGKRDKLNAYISALDKKDILEVARSGAMGVGRGERSLRI